MNYNKFKTIAFNVEKMKLDINGNIIRKLTFYKVYKSGILTKYKTIKTNESIYHLSNDEIIHIWG